MLWSAFQHVACNILQRGQTSLTVLNYPSNHHEQSLTLNNVGLPF